MTAMCTCVSTVNISLPTILAQINYFSMATPLQRKRWVMCNIINMCPINPYSKWSAFSTIVANMRRPHKGKRKGNCIAVHGTPSHSYGVSLAIWDHIHTVLPATQHKWMHSAFTPASQAGTRFTYPGGIEGWVDLGDLLHTEMVHPPAGGHPSKY